MDKPSSSSFDFSYPVNDYDLLQTSLFAHHPTQQLLYDDHPLIIQDQPSSQVSQVQDDSYINDDFDNLLAQMPCFLEEEQQDHHQQEQQERAINGDGVGGEQEQQRKSGSSLVVPHNDQDKNIQKNILHKQVEKQRRLHMSSLHASLRTLLPLHAIQGKRSMSDHLDEATKYIGHLQQKIKVISEQRDGLIRRNSNNNNKKKKSSKAFDGYEVSVNPWNNNGGVEVIIVYRISKSSDNSEDDPQHQGLVPLSRLLQCLTKQGLDVVNCISNTLNTQLVHSIQAQVAQGRSIVVDPVKLQQKLHDIHNFT